MLTPEQVLFVGLIGSALTLLIKLLAQWFGVSLGRAPLTIALYVISLILGGLWTGVFIPTFPPFVDPVSFVAAVLKFVSDLLALAAPVVAMATLIYNLLYEKVVIPVAARVTFAGGRK